MNRPTRHKVKDSLVKRLKQRPILWKYNEDIYIVQSSDSNIGFDIVQRSNGMVLAKSAWSFGWQQTKGFYYGNKCQRLINREMPKFKLIGVK